MSYNRASAISWLVRRQQPFTSHDLAEALGVSRRTANRLLVALADDGFVVDVAIQQSRTSQRVVYESAVGFRHGGAPPRGRVRFSPAAESYIRADSTGFAAAALAMRHVIERRVVAGHALFEVLAALRDFVEDAGENSADVRLAMGAYYQEHPGSKAAAIVGLFDELERLLCSVES